MQRVLRGRENVNKDDVDMLMNRMNILVKCARELGNYLRLVLQEITWTRGGQQTLAFWGFLSLSPTWRSVVLA